ncbi:hypothetical protein F2Q68_00021341 [Brassica cretica]|uniref:Uncharacterized protein n=1 Tax=Brassica cretica TaxID=69181 RepID=A0A8S9FRH7_BRACR|nr:hypothetical protein F2Q68_00021341 [Brassica cretica]
MEGSPYRKYGRFSLSEVFHFPGEGGGSRDRTRKTPRRGTGDPGNQGSFQQRSRGGVLPGPQSNAQQSHIKFNICNAAFN